MLLCNIVENWKWWLMKRIKQDSCCSESFHQSVTQITTIWVISQGCERGYLQEQGLKLIGQESWYLFLDNFKRCLQGTKCFGNSRNHSQTFSDSFGAMCLHPWVQCKFTHGCYVYAPISKWCCPCSILSKKCYHQKKKNEKISLVVICDLVPMFSKTETDTLRSPP